MKPTRRAKKTSHLGRNIVILAFIVIIGVAVALSLSTPNPQFFIIIHAYDAPIEYSSFESLPFEALANGTTLTISGPANFGPDTTPTGILSIPTQVPSGTYRITAEKTGYQTRSIDYVVGANCAGREILPSNSVTCHVLVRLVKVSSQ